MFISLKKVTFLLISISAFSGLNVHAAEIPLYGPIPFEAFDKDSNKTISPQEFVETHNLRKQMRSDENIPSGRNSRSFTYFDTNGDSLISADEMDMNRGAMRSNKKGMSSGANRERQMPKFTDFDLDGDGVMLRDEFVKARAERMRKRAEQGYKMRNAANAPPFGVIDTNHDGKVTKKEFAAHQESHRMMRQNSN